MHKLAETFHANKCYKLAIVAVFKIETFSTLFGRYLHKNEALRTPLLSKKKKELLQHCIAFFMTQDKRQHFQFLRCGFSKGSVL